MSGGRTMRIGLVGVGMFGGDVHLRTYADLVRNGIAPYLGRLAMDEHARSFADIHFELCAAAARSEKSAERAADTFHAWTGNRPACFFGETPWEPMLDAFPDLDILAVATPDHLHAPPALHALNLGVHVILEKPMTLCMSEADHILNAARSNGRIVGMDMHKRYDPDHLRIFHTLTEQIGQPLFGRAVLEEPLEVSTKTFKWAAQSDPFSYVGVHWTDLFIHYWRAKPRSVFAVGQKAKLIGEYHIDAYDAVQVSVLFDNGAHVQFNNHWILPPDFEGPVNQESEILGTRGKIESDSQYRGLRYFIEGGGTRTANTHMTRQIQRADGSEATVGYGKDSLIACAAAIARHRFNGETIRSLKGTYPDGEDGRLSVAVVEAARETRDLNFRHFKDGRGTPATALLNEEGILIYDPIGGNRRIYGGEI